MSKDPIIKGFREQYDKFADMLDKQISLCPDNLWNRKGGGFLFWQQILHTLVVPPLYFLAEDTPFLPQGLNRREVALLDVPKISITQAEMAEISKQARSMVYAYLDTLTAHDLQKEHEAFSALLKRPMSTQDALSNILTHTAYHVGCCDAVLRENGLEGVY